MGKIQKQAFLSYDNTYNLLGCVVEGNSRHLVGAVQAVDDPAMPLVPDLYAAVVGSTHNERRPPPGRIGRVDVARVALQPLDSLAGRDVEDSDGLVGRRGVDHAAVDVELKVDDGAAVAAREHVEVVALAVHVPQNLKEK